MSMLRWVMTPSNGATTLLIELLLVQHLQLRLLRHHIGLRDRDRGLLRLQGLDVDRALLLRSASPASPAARRDPT